MADDTNSPSPAQEPAEHPASDLGDTIPHTPLPEEQVDPAAAQPTQLMDPVVAEPEPIPPFDPEAAQPTQLTPAVAGGAIMAGDTGPVPEPVSPLLVSTVPMVTAGSRVVIVVSRGPYEIPPASVTGMPQVTGMSQGEGLSQLQQAGLSAQVFNEYSEAARGEVIGQTPAYGAAVPVGSEAVLLISGGPAPESTLSVPLPDVVGLTEADAIAALQQAGLSPQIVRDFSLNVPLGVVVEQLPSAHGVPEPPKKPRSLWWLWMLLVLAVLFAASGAVYYYINRTAAVPNLVGLSQAQAEKAIQAAGFKLGSVATTQTLTPAEVGKVLKQNPLPNSQVRLIDPINIVIGGGLKLIQVPDVTGKPQSMARSELASASLQVSVSQAYSATVPTDTVISQSPAAGEQVPANTTVGITVSVGKQTGASTTPVTTPSAPVAQVIVPGVVSLTQSDAQSKITAAGLVATTQQQTSASVKAGNVIAQSPSAGMSVPAGGSVLLTVSSGPPLVSMPSLYTPTKLSTSKARSVVKSAGLVPTVFTQRTYDTAAGYCFNQFPATGTSVAQGTAVAVMISSSKVTTAYPNDPFTVPYVVSKKTSSAVSTLKANHLLAATFGWAGTGAPKGTVIAQIPDANVSAPRNTKVLLIVAK